MTNETAWLRMAETALAYWGGTSDPPVLVKARENVVFRAVLRTGAGVALRLHRPGYQSRQAIEAELLWSDGLAEAGLPVPRAVRTLKGALTARAGDRVASVVGWLSGLPVGSAERRLAGTADDQRRLMARVGALLARLHDATDRLILPEGRDRPRWDEEGLLGKQPLWGRFWESPALSVTERDLILDAAAVARGMLADCRAAGTDFGLIHGDVLRENLLDGDAGLSLIDFDDSGWGWRLYDLATAVVQSLEEPGLDAIVAGLVEGYRSGRRLSATDEARLPLFVMLRTFASTGWITSRAAPGDPRQAFYASRAVRMARCLLDASSPWRGQSPRSAQIG
jgi:Ser/Thr protein kinase RdoA (MazF antagonist)